MPAVDVAFRFSIMHLSENKKEILHFKLYIKFLLKDYYSQKYFGYNILAIEFKYINENMKCHYLMSLFLSVINIFNVKRE